MRATHLYLSKALLLLSLRSFSESVPFLAAESASPPRRRIGSITPAGAQRFQEPKKKGSRLGSLGGLKEAKGGRNGSMVVKGGGASVSTGVDGIRSGRVVETVEQQRGQTPVRLPLGSVSSLLGSKAAKGGTSD